MKAIFSGALAHCLPAIALLLAIPASAADPYPNKVIRMAREGRLPQID